MQLVSKEDFFPSRASFIVAAGVLRQLNYAR